ncbi:unnamed protein product [Rhizophagus irregularis]|uniref:VWFA domain-containing protein n=1 Tax=Rhizophagus irregularis TaxID=588596 RepID=A0A915ZTQ5_9GLOM|nr:unnamed protein product [Rhizophagus irregularis]
MVNTREYIYVALDFEGLKSLERTPQEDMFLMLFNTVVSSLILFKNQFTINRDVSTMFQKFQDGAKLFESDPEIFQARLWIIIKDVPQVDENDIKREFQLKLSQLVKAEGEDNFITRMYKGGMNITPWPVFNDIAWFKNLAKIKKSLDKQKTKYENAKTFLQNTKVIMAKLKICDWGSLNENLIQIRVAMLKRLFPIAVSYGLEQKDPNIECLMNYDSGEQINDSIIDLCDILKDFKNSSKIETLKCNKKIPPNEFKHTGKHTHNENGFHYRDAKCRCEYYCTLSYKHKQKDHDTRHGNMTQTEFTGEDNEFEYLGHKLRVGDQGTFVLCNLFCKELGRHRHIDYCQNEEICKIENQNIQHINEKVSPNPDRSKDFISHKLYWERTGFKDPYSVQEQQEFTKYRSDSMRAQDKKPISRYPIYNDLIKEHDNRIGAVYQAVYYFVETRINSVRTNHNQMSLAMRDNISLILFNTKVIIPFENRDLTDLTVLLDIMLKQNAYGGTSYDLAIQKAGSLIETHFDPTKVNIIIFLSDGECGAPMKQLRAICEQNKAKGSPLYLYTQKA